MRMQRGFTVVEVIFCIVIICIVAAILQPVFRSSRHSAQVSASLSNLHQMYVALMLYQGSEGASGQYGTLASMGLPSQPPQIFNGYIPKGLWHSPCGRNPEWFDSTISVEYEYYAATSADPFDKVGKIYQENSVMFIDMNCSDHNEPLHSEFVLHQGLGVQLSGALLNLHKGGSFIFENWWTSPPGS